MRLVVQTYKSITNMIIVVLTSGVSRPLSIMNFEGNVMQYIDMTIVTRFMQV